MAENSKIEWCDHTFNPWTGCKKVSPACANCYAEALWKRFGKDFKLRNRTSEANWKLPLKWNRMAASCGTSEGSEKCPICSGASGPHRPRVFSASLADWLDDEVPIEWLADFLELIWSTKHLDWLLLTKRPENWKSRLCFAADHLMKRGVGHEWLFNWIVAGIPPHNVWIGATIENDAMMRERHRHLVAIPAAVHFWSGEPLLGLLAAYSVWKEFGAPDWVICGGESGHNARPMHPDWARSLRDQCQAAGVPFLFKQWGQWAPGYNFIDHIPSGERCDFGDASLGDDGSVWKVGKKTAGRLLDGAEHNEFPEVVR